MKKIKKIISTIIIFIIIMIIICFILSILDLLNGNIILTNLPNQIGQYLLYIIGYGGLNDNVIIQNILAILGIVSIALLSTYLTIELFWRDTDVDIINPIKYNNNKLYFTINNKGNTICDVKLSFSLYNELECINASGQKEYYIPIINKNSNWNLSISTNDTFWFNALRNIINKENKLYYMLSFVDTKNGQSSIKINELDNNSIEYNDRVITMNDLLKPIYIDNLLPIENSNELSYDKNKLSYTFLNNSFVMVYASFHEIPLNILKYGANNASLVFTSSSIDKTILTVEIKNDNDKYSQEFIIDKKEKEYILEFSDVNINLEAIREICFTIFSKNNPNKGNITIKNVMIKII